MENAKTDIDAVTAAMVSAQNGHAMRRARLELDGRDRADVVQALIRTIRRATDQKVFDRAAKVLAEYGGDEAVGALAREARTQRQFPRLAVRALALCDHPQVVPELLDILEFSTRLKPRRAAAYALARLRAPRAVEPLCKASLTGQKRIGPEASAALGSMGRPEQIARLVLSEHSYSPADRVRVLHTMAAADLFEGFWRRQRFDAKRFLERESANARSPWRDRAAETLQFLAMQSTLLRGVDPAPPDTLLRAAAGSPAGSAALLRAAESDDAEGEPRPVLRRLISLFTGRE